MKQKFVRVAVGAVLVLMALVGSLPHRAAAASPPVGTLLVVAGTGDRGFSGDGGPATQAQLNSPFGLAFDVAGNLFIGEHGGPRVRKVTPAGIISTAVGGGNTPPGLIDGVPAAQAELGDAEFLAFDGAGALFLSGFYAYRVWKVSPEGLVTLIQDNGHSYVAGVAVDAAGNLFFVDWGTALAPTGQVLRRTPGGIITTVAGTGEPGYSGDGGPATQAQLDFPFGLAVDAAGNLFIADANNSRVRRVGPDGVIITVAGGGTALGDGGPATQAALNSPFGLAVDAAGNLFIADPFDYRVRKVTPDGIITTVAGTGDGQLSGVGGPATSAGLRGPQGLAVDAAGNLFIADSAWVNQHLGGDHGPANERILEVVGVAAPGLIAGKPFPKQ